MEKEHEKAKGKTESEKRKEDRNLYKRIKKAHRKERDCRTLKHFGIHIVCRKEESIYMC